MRFKGGIRRKVALFISLVVLTIVTIGVGLGYFSGFILLKKDIGINLERAADMMAQQVSEKINDEMFFLHSSFTYAAIIAALKDSNLSIRNIPPAEVGAFMESMDSQWAPAERDSVLVKKYLDSAVGIELKKRRRIDNHIVEMLVSDRYGALVAASDKTTDFYQADEAWWRGAFADEKGEDFLGDVELDESSGSSSMIFAIPVRDDDGSVAGIAKAVVDVRGFFRFLQDIRIGRTGRIAIIDGDGRIIQSADAVPSGEKISLNGEDLNKVLRGNIRQLIMDSRDEKPVRKFLAFSLIKNPLLLSRGVTWRVFIVQDTREAFTPLYRMIAYAMTLSVILCALALPSGYLFGRIFVSPIERLHHAAEMIGRGNLGYKVNIRTGDEIESLADAFFDMSEAVKERERKMLSAKIYNDSIISSMADALIVVNLDATIRSVNKSTLGLLGYSEDELIGKPVKMIFFKEEEEEEEEEEEALNRYFKKIISEGSAYNIGLTFVTKQGKPIPVNFSGTVMREGEEITGVVGLARDMRAIMTIISDLAKMKKDSDERSRYLTQMQRAMLHIMEDLKSTKDDLQRSYEKLNAAQSELIQSEKEAALGRFSLGVSHEVKNPLAVILGGVEFLENKLADSSEDIKTNVSIIKKSALRANSILESILQYVRPSSLNIEAVGLNDLVNEVIPLFRLQPSSVKSEIVTEFGGENIRVSVDRNRIHQVIFNVVKNAIEAMNGIGNVIVRTNAAEGMGVIKVIDSGVGIPKNAMPNIFEPFFTTKRPGKGTGLGLVVSKAIIDNHKGKLLIQSEEGSGTVVKIVLPLA